MGNLARSLILALFIVLSYQCSQPTGHCSSPCSTDFPSNGGCSYAPLIAKHEGCCQCAYLDTLGKPTIGIGYLLTSSRASQLSQVGASYSSLVSGQSSLDSTQINNLFDQYVQSSVAVAQKTYPKFNSMPCNVKQALIDIIYDLNNGISAFTQFNSYINNEQWEQAATDLLGSLFCKQVGQRCTDDANLIREGGKNHEEEEEEKHEEAKEEEIQKTQSQEHVGQRFTDEVNLIRLGGKRHEEEEEENYEENGEENYEEKEEENYEEKEEENYEEEKEEEREEETKEEESKEEESKEDAEEEEKEEEEEQEKEQEQEEEVEEKEEEQGEFELSYEGSGFEFEDSDSEEFNYESIEEEEPSEVSNREEEQPEENEENL